jgi:glycerate 2-kinase
MKPELQRRVQNGAAMAYRCVSTMPGHSLDTTSSTVALLVAAYDAAVAACDPEAAVATATAIDDEGITIGGERFDGATPREIVVVAIGKAASAMVRGIVSVLGPVRGLAVSNHEGDCPVPLMVGAHPVPDETSLACGESLLSFVRSLESSDVVVYLISGGGSSIAVAPVDGVSLSDIAVLNHALMAAGIPIGEMNEVRAAVSTLKGGRLASACASDRSITLVLSDVVGAGPSHVASGPTLGSGMGAKAGAIVARYRIEGALPASAIAAINESSPVTGGRGPFSVVGSSDVAANAAARYLASRGVASTIATTQLQGEARIEARRLTEDASGEIVTIATGETTVSVMGDGIGGRNQEAALSVAIMLSESDTVFLACGTDGIDGPTTAAGAVVDGGTAMRAEILDLDLDRALSLNDSHTALVELDAVVIRGDTGTNVADIWMVAKGIESGLDA